MYISELSFRTPTKSEEVHILFTISQTEKNAISHIIYWKLNYIGNCARAQSISQHVDAGQLNIPL